MIKDRNERINFMMCYDDRNKYQPLSKASSRVRFDFFRYTKMAEDHFQRAIAILSFDYIRRWKEYCFELDTSWYYLLCAAECGELDFIDATGEEE